MGHDEDKEGRGGEGAQRVRKSNDGTSKTGHMNLFIDLLYLSSMFL